MHLGHVLLVTSAVLGGLVVILAAIYAYIYCTKIRPGGRNKHEDRGSIYVRDARSHSCADSNQNDGDKRPMHPFLIWSYAAKFRRESGVDP